MSLALPSLTWWLWGSKRKESKNNGSSLNTTASNKVQELSVLKVPAAHSGNTASASRKVRRKWHSCEEGKIDKEYDAVVVADDEGGSASDADSVASDWSIGWSEPHPDGFFSDGEIDAGFGVLVPCYGHKHRGNQGGKKNMLSTNANVPQISSAESNKFMEQWLSNLHIRR